MTYGNYKNGVFRMLVGYMRVSSEVDRQNTDLQRDALLVAGVDSRHLFEDRASGAKDNRSRLAKVLAFLQPGDMLIVWKLDRLGRSLTHLIEIINGLKTKGVGFRSLTEGMGYHNCLRGVALPCFRSLSPIRARSHYRKSECRSSRCPKKGPNWWSAQSHLT